MTIETDPRAAAVQGLILLGHGSRDPAWCEPFEAVAAQLRSARPALLVVCAYLQLCSPDMSQAVTQLRVAGCRSIAIAPLFLGLGRHMREDLPLLLAALQHAHPTTAFTLLPVLGDSSAMQQIMSQYLLGELAAIMKP